MSKVLIYGGWLALGVASGFIGISPGGFLVICLIVLAITIGEELRGKDGH